MRYRKMTLAAAAILAVLAIAAAVTAQAEPRRTIAPGGGSMGSSQTERPTTTTPIGTGRYTYSSGVSVAVVNAYTFTIGEIQSGAGPDDVGVIITITVTNGTHAFLEADLVDVGLRSGTAGLVEDRVFGAGLDVQGVGGPVAPGSSVTGSYAFGVHRRNLVHLAVLVKPAIDLGAAIFTGAAHQA